jgi:hypothetical protein
MISRFESEKGLAAENGPPRAVKPGVLSNIRIAWLIPALHAASQNTKSRNQPSERTAESLSSTHSGS